MLSSYTGHENTSAKTECCLTNTDAHVIAASEDGRVVMYDLVNGKQVHTLNAHKGCVTSVTYHPDQVCMLTSGVDGIVRVWK